MTTASLPTNLDTAQEAELVSQVRRGNQASCTAFVAHFGAPVFNYLYWLTGDGEEAEAVFKDTALYLCLNPGRVRKERSVRSWVYRHVTQTWLQSRKQRQQQRRSSLANILRGGLESATDSPWSDWKGRFEGRDGESLALVEDIVEKFDDFSDLERAALFLLTVAELPIEGVAAGLRISLRKTRNHIVSAFGSLTPRKVGLHDAPARRAHDLSTRRVLALETVGQAKKLDKLLSVHPEHQEFEDAGKAALSTLKNLPNIAAPENLTEATVTHLAEGHAALETRIATWGFRFMLLTVPLFILAILTVILFPAINRSREMALRAAAAENLQTLGQALHAYSDQSPGNHYPALTSQKDLWVPDLKALYPKFIQDPTLLVSPSLNDPELIASLTEALSKEPVDWETAHELLARSYVYTGYTLLDDSAMASFAQVRNMDVGIDLNADVETADRRFFHLRQGVEQFFVGDVNLDPDEAPAAPLRIPVMFEHFTTTGFGGMPEGANVLYLDGTVEYVSFGSAYPVDETVLALLKGSRTH